MTISGGTLASSWPGQGSSPFSNVRAEDCLAGGGEMGALMRAKDWAATPLGPVSAWPHSLRTVVGLCLSSRYPITLFWGPQLIEFYNDAYRPILGATKHPAALGQAGHVTWPEIWDFIGPMFADVMTKGISHAGDDTLFLLDRNGYVEETYFNFSYDPIRDDDGRVGGVFVACQETTDRVLGERRLQTLRKVAEIANTAKTDPEICRDVAQALEANPADVPFALLYLLDGDGRSARLMAATRVAPDQGAAPERLELDQASAWSGPVAESIRTAEPQLFALPGTLDVRPPPDDLPRPTQAIAIALPRRGERAAAGVLVVGRNPRRAFDDRYRNFLGLLARNVSSAIADARAFESERRRAEALAELDRAKTAFFSNVSHEFRTPLTLILAPLEDALAGVGGPLPAAVQDSLQAAHRNSLRLLKLVNSLLDFARIESGRAQAVYEPVDLAALTSELAGVFRSAVERAGLRLEVDCPPLPAAVWVDQEMYEKIVLNLLSNAFKYTFEGSIAVELRWRDDHVELSVRDTGTGIPPAELSHLFRRFHRVEGARARTQEGTGIGLALVQELARLHGGSVAVNSEVGQGSCFTVRLKTGAAHLPAERKDDGRARVPTAIRASVYLEEALRWLPDGHTPSPEPEVMPVAAAARDAAPDAEALPRVLVADDNADMRDYMRRLLGQRWAVQTAADGEAALAAIRRDPPDLVLTDVMMPRLDGFGLLRAIRADADCKHIPVIMLSARAGEEARVEGLDAGADDYLIKPFGAREIIARVNSQLTLARARREEVIARRQMERLRAEAEQANRAKDEFLAMLGHELRNPLAPIVTALQLMKLKGGPQAPFGRERQLIERQLDHLVRLVDDLLDVSRIARGKLELKRQPTEMATVVTRAVELASPLFERRRHKLALDLPVESLCVNGDAHRLTQVLANLLTNAAKYTEPGGHIEVRARAEADEFVASVRDDGVGIPDNLLPHVFDLFVQGRRDGETVSSGLGIGLAIVRSLVTAHGGSISAHSTGPGKGSTFTLRLPLIHGDIAAAAPPTNALQAAPRSHRVLVVDDNPEAAEILAEGLREVGHVSRVAHDGPRALAVASEFEPTVCVLDIGLPAMDGYELAERLREQLGPQVMLVALTGYGQPRDRAHSKQAGFAHHLVKPIDLADLAGLLSAHSSALPGVVT